MGEWKEYKLGDCVEMQKGFAFKSSDYTNNGIKIIKVSNLNQKRFDDDSCVFISPDLEDQYSRYSIKEDDIIISTVGSWPMNPESVVGKVCRVQKIINGSLLNQNAVRLRVKNNFNQRFIYYILSSSHFSSFIANAAQGSANQASITLDDIKSYVFNSPSFLDQERIANFLKSLDDKIEVNRRINDNLEQQAEALFKSWFVDFEPFKDGEFVESELGMIPKGWRVTSLSSIADYVNGLAMQKFRPNEGEKGLPVLKIKELGQGNIDANSELCSPSMIGDKYIIDDGDIIFSWSGTLMVKIWCGGKCGLNQHLFVVVPKDFPRWFVYLWTKHHLDNFIRIAKDKAVTMGHIKRGELDKALVVVPKDEDLYKINALMAPIHQQIINNELESRRLAELRDTLLPRLMSGELKINDI